jgi:hypothetical protein
MIFFLRYIIMTRQYNYNCDGCSFYSYNDCMNSTFCKICPLGCTKGQGILGATANVGATSRLTDAANKSLPKENARLVKQVLGGLAGLTSAACVVTAYIAAEKARKEKSLLNKVLTGAAAAGSAAAAVEIGVQSYDLFMNREQ